MANEASEKATLTRDQVSERLKLSLRQVDRLIDSGHLQAIKYDNGAVRVTEESVLVVASNRPRRLGPAEGDTAGEVAA